MKGFMKMLIGKKQKWTKVDLGIKQNFPLQMKQFYLLSTWCFIIVPQRRCFKNCRIGFSPPSYSTANCSVPSSFFCTNDRNMFLQQRWLVRLPAAVSSFVEYLFALFGVAILHSHAHLVKGFNKELKSFASKADLQWKDYFILSDFASCQRKSPVYTLAELAAHVSSVVILLSSQ